MGTFILFFLALLVIAGVLFLLASFAFGRGEEMAAARPDSTPVELPDERPVLGADVRGLRLSVSIRGYRMGEVDWVLEQLAVALDDRDRVIEQLRHPGPQADELAGVPTAAPAPTAAAPAQTSDTSGLVPPQRIEATDG